MKQVTASALALPFLAVAAAASTNYVDLVTADSPLAWYRFEEAAAATEVISSTVQTQPSVVLNNVTLAQPGILGTAASFAGSSWINLPFLLDPGAGQDFSVEVWVNSPRFTTATVDMIIVAQKDANGTGRSVIFHDSDASDQFANFFRNALRKGANTVAITDNTWHHVVQTFRASDFSSRFWVDGVDLGLATPALTALPESTQGGWVLGSHKLNTQQFFTGLIDEFAVYPYLLDDPDGDGNTSDSKVLAHYRALVPQPPLVITAFAFDGATAAASFTWSSEAGAVYRIVASDDLTKWEPVAEEIPSGGATTAHTLGNAPDGTRYYRVERTR